MRTLPLWLVLALQLALPSRSSWATSFMYQPFPEVIQQTPVIVHGKVGSSYSDWGKGTDGTKRIYTFSELQVDETLKGQSQVQATSILMREIGGEKDGLGMQVAGASHFERGEDIVVMLGEKNPDGSYEVQGLMMGKLVVKRDEAGKDIVDGPALSPIEAHEHAIESGETEPKKDAPWTLARMRKVIAEQAHSPVPSSSVSPQQKPSASPSPHPSSVISAAPQLQPSPAAEGATPPSFAEKNSGSLIWILGGAAALILLAWGTRKATRKKKK